MHAATVPSIPKSARISAILEVLERTYPDAHCELNFQSPLELLMATILSAQCTDVRVNQVTKVLFDRCKTARDYVEIPVAELESIIRSTGFYRAKAKNLKSCASALVTRHGGEVPRSLEELTQLAGVGRKTANVVLGDAFQTPYGVVVDTHVQRLSTRLGLTKANTPEKIEKDLIGLIPNEQWTIFSHWLIWHGRRRCTARSPDCGGCELRGICLSVDQFGKKGGRVVGKGSSSVVRMKAIFLGGDKA
jgi:endonuclease-3